MRKEPDDIAPFYVDYDENQLMNISRLTSLANVKNLTIVQGVKPCLIPKPCL